MLALTALFAGSTWAGDDKGSGGGTAEAAVLMAAKNLASYHRLCVASKNCGLDADQKALVARIGEELGSLDPMKLIEFKNEKDSPGFFRIGGVTRAAITRTERGATIYVNRDLLYPKDAAGREGPLSYAGTVALLTHEFGHHQGIHEEAPLELLGAKLQLFMGGSVSETANGLILINFYTFDSKTGTYPHTQLLERDDFGITDTSDGVAEAVFAAHASTPSCDRPVGFWISNIHTVRMRDEDFGPDFMWTRSQGNLWVVCDNLEGTNVSGYHSHDIRISTRVDHNGPLTQTGTFKYRGVKSLEFFDCTQSSETRCH
jgi:hypothetical protein